MSEERFSNGVVAGLDWEAATKLHLALGEWLRQQGKQVCSRASADRVIPIACAALGTRPEDFLRRDAQDTRVRHIAWWILRYAYGLRFTTIGYMTRRDHSTVIVATKKIERRRAEYDHDISRVLSALSAAVLSLAPSELTP